MCYERRLGQYPENIIDPDDLDMMDDENTISLGEECQLILKNEEEKLWGGGRAI